MQRDIFLADGTLGRSPDPVKKDGAEIRVFECHRIGITLSMLWQADAGFLEPAERFFRSLIARPQRQAPRLLRLD
jgi:hypothetical protein